MTWKPSEDLQFERDWLEQFSATHTHYGRLREGGGLVLVLRLVLVLVLVLEQFSTTHMRDVVVLQHLSCKCNRSYTACNWKAPPNFKMQMQK